MICQPRLTTGLNKKTLVNNIGVGICHLPIGMAQYLRFQGHESGRLQLPCRSARVPFPRLEQKLKIVRFCPSGSAQCLSTPVVTPVRYGRASEVAENALNSRATTPTWLVCRSDHIRLKQHRYVGSYNSTSILPQNPGA